jgi:hypothetical protein
MKKVKKFGRGGDILTGLGAGLMGYALYKKLKGEDKDEKESEAVGGAGRRARTIEEQIGRKAEPKERSAEEKRALATSKGRPELIPEGADEATMRSDNYPTPKPKPKPAAKDVKVKPAAQSTVEGSTPKDKSGYAPAPRNVRSMIEGKGPSGAKGTQDVGKALGMSSNAKGTQTLGDRIKGTFESAGKSVVRTPAERMAEAARQVEERRKREAEGMKKGGKVKKYASGGSVSSASKRADGIAQRGKTKGRIC